MTPTIISVAILLVAVNVALLVWFEGSEAAASAGRTMGMMKRVGLSPEIASRDDAATRALLKEIRRRCRRCPREDFCNRWLAREVDGDNAFCRNAQRLGMLGEARREAA